MSSLSELGFKLVRTLFRYFNFLSHMPYAQYVVLGSGSFIVFIKTHVNPRSWRRTRKK